MATINGRQIRDVAADRLGALQHTLAVPAVSRIAQPTTPPTRDITSRADAQQVSDRQDAERIPEGNVRRGLGSF